MDKPVRRVRGNTPPPQDDPVVYWAEEEQEPMPPETDVGDFLWAFAIILLTTAVMAFAFGRWSA